MLIPVLIAYLLFPAETSHFLAQTAGEAGPWLTALNLGLAGIGLFAFTTGRIHSDKELQRVIDRCDAEHQRVVVRLDAAEAELRASNREWVETLGPTLTRATVQLGRFVDSTPPPPSKRRQ